VDSQNLEHLISTLFTSSSEGHSVSSVLPPPSLPSLTNTTSSSEDTSPLYLPMILVPPELDETDLTLLSGSTGATGEKALPAPSTSAGLRGDEGVGYEGTRLQLRLFEDDSVPNSDDRAGNVLRGLISDVVNLYEVNRKEGAGVLLELPRWVKEGTFRDPKVKKKAVEDEEMNGEDEERKPEGPQWSLENLIVEVSLERISLPFSSLAKLTESGWVRFESFRPFSIVFSLYLPLLTLYLTTTHS